MGRVKALRGGHPGPRSSGVRDRLLIPCGKLPARAAAVAACLVLACAPHARATLHGSDFVDLSFSLLEAGNPIAARYGELTGREVRPLFRLGVPYFFGGSKIENVGLPATAHDSNSFYTAGKNYLGGLDCIGFIRWVYGRMGLPGPDELPRLLSEKLYGRLRVDLAGLRPEAWQGRLSAGDLLVTHGNGRHILMYVGTLRLFGYTEPEAPGLAAYLDHPLVIHCSSNAFHPAWYRQYLREEGLRCGGTVGGVMLSLLGVPEDAPAAVCRTPYGNAQRYFPLEGYMLTVYELGDAAASRWLSWYDGHCFLVDGD